MKGIYYEFVNFIQSMHAGWFALIWFALFVSALLLTTRFYKVHNGTQKTFEKISLLILAVIIFAVLIFLTYLRK